MFGKHYIKTNTRAQFSLETFGEYFNGCVLDVGAGGSAGIFRKQLNSRYVALDVSKSRETPDVYADIERYSLPFKNDSFDTVLSFDSLEHCDSIHRLFDELVRVSRHYVVISLPNNWPGFLASALRGHNVTHTRGYGLPPDAPAPGVRHKWFFNMEEAEVFIRRGAARTGTRIVELRHVYEPGNENLFYLFGVYPRILRIPPDKIRSRGLGMYVAFLLARYGLAMPLSWIEEVVKRLLWGWGSRYRYLNLFCRQLWVVLEKPGVDGSPHANPK